MPELARFFGIIVRMYFADTDRHHQAHVHVEADGDKAAVALDGTVLAGRLPPKKLTVLQAWLFLHEDELHTAWEKAANHEIPGTIRPLA